MPPNFHETSGLAVGPFAVLGKVQAHFLFQLIDPQAHDAVEYLGQHEGDHEDEYDGHRHAEGLDAQLAGVAVEQAGRLVDLRGREKAGGQGAPGAGHAVAGPDVQGLVQVSGLAEADGVVADGRRDGPDDDGPQGG